MSKKGYWIVRVDVKDPEGYKKYLAANPAAFKKYGAHFLVRGGPFDAVAGTARERNVVIEFKDIETARACYDSPEYQAAVQHLAKVGPTDLVIIEGYEGAQPGD